METKPRNGEAIIVNAEGEKRIVPRTMLRNTAILTMYGWREHREPKIALDSNPAIPGKLNEPDKELPNDIDPDANTPFQDLTKENTITKKPAGRPRKTD